MDVIIKYIKGVCRGYDTLNLKHSFFIVTFAVNKESYE